jgi:GT2 family glycosyltransferase
MTPTNTSRLVSVIIPTFNATAFIRRTLTSVYAQTYRPLEVIVVDDGSSDDTCDIIRNDFPQVRLICQENSGIPAVPRNVGIGAATGEYIAFLDHDDEWLPEKIATQVGIMSTSPPSSICLTQRRTYVEGNQETGPANLGASGDLVEIAFAQLLDRSFYVRYCTSFSSWLIPKNAFRQLGYLDANVVAGADDWEFLLRATFRQWHLVMLDLPLMTYHIHSSNMSVGSLKHTTMTPHLFDIVERFDPLIHGSSVHGMSARRYERVLATQFASSLEEGCRLQLLDVCARICGRFADRRTSLPLTRCIARLVRYVACRDAALAYRLIHAYRDAEGTYRRSMVRIEKAVRPRRRWRKIVARLVGERHVG